MVVSDLSIGTDIVETERIGRLLRRFGDAFLAKIFNGDEICHCKGEANFVTTLAGKFAAKEAFSKALGTGVGKNFGWRDISIKNKQSGEPHIVLSKNAEIFLDNHGFFGAKVSISHTKTLAQAVVVLIR
jgi:holo-[acyl-carrier protein] synthase